MKRVPLVLSLLLASACNSEPDSKNQPIDPNDPNDVGDCALEAGMGSMGALADAAATQRNQMGSMGAAQFHQMNATLDGTAPIDLFRVELWDQYGVFTGGDATTGTFEIVGAETNVLNCGVCIFLYQDIDEVALVPAKTYMASGGMIDITTLGTTLVGSVTGLQFREVDNDTFEPVAGGCTSSLASANFDAAVTVIPGGGGGGG
jgi:hypothetical protein